MVRIETHTAGAKGMDRRQKHQQAHEHSGEARAEEGHGGNTAKPEKGSVKESQEVILQEKKKARGGNLSQPR